MKRLPSGRVMTVDAAGGCRAVTTAYCPSLGGRLRRDAYWVEWPGLAVDGCGDPCGVMTDGSELAGLRVETEKP